MELGGNKSKKLVKFMILEFCKNVGRGFFQAVAVCASDYIPQQQKNC